MRIMYDYWTNFYSIYTFIFMHLVMKRRLDNSLRYTTHKHGWFRKFIMSNAEWKNVSKFNRRCNGFLGTSKQTIQFEFGINSIEIEWNTSVFNTKWNKFLICYHRSPKCFNYSTLIACWLEFAGKQTSRFDRLEPEKKKHSSRFLNENKNVK